MPLDPLDLTPAASLNRMPLLALPGIQLDAGAAGALAYDLLGRQALVGQIRQHAAALGIDAATAEDAELPLLLDACFVSRNAQVRRTAEQIARRFGRNLGALVLTLQLGHPLSRRARPE